MKAGVLDSINRGEPALGPSTVHIDITNGCNTNCVTCWDHSPYLDKPRSAAWKRQRVDVGHVVDLLDDLGALGGLSSIVLSGMGEPFTHPDVYTMIEAIKARDLHLTIITNLVAADADRVLALGVDQLLIGVHGASEGAYLAFHPSFRPEEWKKLNAMLAKFRDAGRRFKQVQVVSQENAHELVDMIDFAASTCAHAVNFKLASLREGTDAVRVTEEQRALLVTSLVPKAIARAKHLGVKTNLRVFEAQLGAGGARTAPIEDVGCFMGYVYSRVLVDGTVLYCCNTDVRVGSLAGGDRFSALWRGEAWRALRAQLRRGEYLSSCDQCGKFNQNVAIGRAFEERFGSERLLAVTGRGEGAAPRTEHRPRRLPIAAR